MHRLFALSSLCVAYILLCTSAASACSIIAPWEGNFKGVQKEWTDVPGVENTRPVAIEGVGSTAWPATEFERLLDEADSVFLAKVKLEKLEHVPSLYEDLSQSRAIFETLKTLKGEDRKAYEYTDSRNTLRLVVDFDKSSPEWQRQKPALDAMTQAQISRHSTDFWYWDHMVHRQPEITAPHAITSCGPGKVPAISSNFTYLVAISGVSVTLVEPVSGVEDPLVKAAITRLETPTQRASREITFKNFADNFRSATIVEIKACSRWLKGKDKDPYYKVEDRYDVRQRKGDVTFSVVEQRKKEGASSSRLEYTLEVWPIIFDYFDLDKDKISCRDGQEILVLDRENSTHPQTHWQTLEPYVPTRFARIENGKVLLQDIKTNYYFSDTEDPDIETIMDLFPENKHP